MIVILTLLSFLVFLCPVRFKPWYTLGIIAAGAAMCCTEAVTILSSALRSMEYEGQYNFVFDQWDTPVIDPLSAIFILIISVAAISVTLYSRDYVAAYAKVKSRAQISLHYLALAALYFSMIGVVVFRGAFSFLFSWELMTIASFVLILFNGEVSESRRAAINYLVLMHVGFVFIMAGFIIGGGGGFGGFGSLGTYFAGHNPVPLFIVFLIGFGMKAGLFPLHIWLPEAHPAAPAHVSAIMSGVMIKTGVYGVLRVLTYIDTSLHTIGVIVLVAGVVTAVWGIILAALQNDLKKLLAYSSIENIGIIFIGIGAGVIGRSSGNDMLALLGFSGALLHVVNHSLFKPLLFMGSGAIYLSTHTMNIDELGGLARRMPLTAVLFLVGSMAICALPPFNGFVSEFLIYLGLFGSISSGSEVMLLIAAVAGLAFAGGLAILVFTKAFGVGFLGTARCCKAEKAREAGVWMLIAQMLPLAGILSIGLFPLLFSDVIAQVFTEMYGLNILSSAFTIPSEGLTAITLVMLLVIAFTVLIYYLKTRALKSRTVTEGPTWGCAFTAPNKRMQYTGESYAEGLQRLTVSMTKETRKGTAISKNEIFAGRHTFGAGHGDKIDKIVSGRWVYLMRKINTKLALFQTGKINHYVLYALLFLALIFLLTITGVI